MSKNITETVPIWTGGITSNSSGPYTFPATHPITWSGTTLNTYPIVPSEPTPPPTVSKPTDVKTFKVEITEKASGDRSYMGLHFTICQGEDNTALITIELEKGVGEKKILTKMRSEDAKAFLANIEEFKTEFEKLQFLEEL